MHRDAIILTVASLSMAACAFIGTVFSEQKTALPPAGVNTDGLLLLLDSSWVICLSLFTQFVLTLITPPETQMEEALTESGTFLTWAEISLTKELSRIPMETILSYLVSPCGTPWKRLLTLSGLFVAVSRLCATVALHYVSLVTLSLFKSSKALGVMLIAPFMGNAKGITPTRVLSVCLITIGSFTYSISEKGGRTRQDTAKGYVFIVISQVLNGIGSNFHDLALLAYSKESSRRLSVGLIQFVMGCSLFVVGAIYTLCTVSRREMCAIPTEWYKNQSVTSLSTGVSMFPIILCLRRYGSLMTAVLSTIKKLLTILFVIFLTGEHVSTKGWVGLIMVFLGGFLGVFERQLSEYRRRRR
ncbi:UAA transporter family protein [Giardia muris]|uniref:UAA transporter family protein n=1 Tax=Giardia muris TaxID=5742 RepID=A0A4Z1STC5_GIAMU|nr:UAA transporter family protein [Giardia muris]|eukprot:TNJ29000.1 UAA transporter family protein [Giardia muris]